MFGKITQLNNFQTFGIGTSNIKIAVEPLQSFAEDGGDLVDSAAVGALDVWVFGGPVGDAHFAEEFAAAVALARVQDNVSAYQAHELLVIGPCEAIWVITRESHFVVFCI